MASESNQATSTGRVFAVHPGGADIVGFDPARDKLDLGDYSVHNFIIVDTPQGVGFMNPWSGEVAIVQGVSLGQLTIDSFTPIINDHLRQDVSGALAWEHGIVQAPHTVYARSHEIGQVDRVSFDPAKDIVDFRYFGTREQIYMTNSSEGVVISNSGTGQALILLGVKVSDLTIQNFVFHSAQVYEDRVSQQLGFSGTVPASQVIARDIPIAGTEAWPTQAGTGAPPSGQVGTTFEIKWLYGVNTTLDFHPATDKLDFGWFKASEFSVTEQNGAVVISIEGNKQTYTLPGVSLYALDLSNIVALDTSARAEWQGLLDAATPPAGLPTLSVDDATVAEGSSGTTLLTFTVRLSAASTTPVSVSYSTLNGTATAGTDYDSAVGSITFAPGETAKTVQVTVRGDTQVEVDETLTLQLSSPSGATIKDGTAVGTIRNDDLDSAPNTPPKVSIADLAVSEGNGEHMHFMFMVTLDKASSETVTVQYATSDGTAKAASDYQATTGTVTFAPGVTSQMVHVDIMGDATFEANETFKVTLSAPKGATIGDGVAEGTILNDDAAPVLPTLSIADASFAEGSAAAPGKGKFVVTLSAASATPVTVKYATSDGTAVAGSDYAAKTGTLTFAAGETQKTISVAAIGDAVSEANETFSVTLTAASGATIADGVAVGTIRNDDAAPVLPTLSIADASFAEGSAGAPGKGTFVVTLSAASATPVTVKYATSDGTAVAGSDYTSKTGTLTFAAGETQKTITVSAIGDGNVEANETFTVKLSSPSGATIADGSATGTIRNDDAAPVAAGDVDYVVRDDWGAGFVADMKVEAGPGGLKGWTVEFDAAFTITNIWNAVIVSHVGNHYVIKNASWNGTLGAGKQAAFGFQANSGAAGHDASGFLLNGVAVGGDPEPVLPAFSVTDASVTEGNSGTKELAFTVSLSSAATAPVTVAYATADGTALAGSDYTAKSGTLTFAAGETSKVVKVLVNGDTAVEGNETFTLNLTNPSGATLADGAGTGTIVNDDVAPLPTLSIAGASFAEGSAATPGHGMFVVSLSQAATSAVTVSFATADGTAVAGSDYVAQTGTLTFAAGETQKVIQVAALGDGTVEPDETFKVTLSSAKGATIAQASATGSITNDDVATPPGQTPKVSISDVQVKEGDPATGAAASGWLSTSGNQIVDADGNSVQIAGVNWFGFESSTLAPHGLWTRNYKEMMDQMVDEGFNTIRLPFSSEMLHTSAAPNGIDFNKNPDLKGLSALQIMDKIVDYAGEIGLKIILDHHRSDSGTGTSDNGLWYNSKYTEAAWISDWQMLAQRYADDPTVIGADLHNEPYNGTWGGGGAKDWAAAAERAGNAIGDVNANWLIFVEGVGTYEGNNYWWGGNLMGVRDRPIDLDATNKLVYSAHDYPNSVYAQPWFQSSDFAAQLPEKFDQMWGYIYREGIAPVYIGEFGTSLTDPKDAPWLEAITSYLSGDFDNDGVSDLAAGDKGPSWTFWSWNPNSGDTGGILNSDWTSVNTAKLAYLKPIQFDFDTDVAGGGDGTPTVFAQFEVSLSEPATGAVTVDYHTMPGTASDTDFVSKSGTLLFAAGEQTKVISIPIVSDLNHEGNETFTVMLTDPHGAVLGVALGTATIVDDDAATPTPPVDPTPTDPTPSGDLEAVLKVADSWSNGFNATIVIDNDGAAVTGWQVHVDMPYQIENIWNAKIISHDASGYVIGNADWNGTIGAGGEVSFGFVGIGTLDPAQVDLII
ncbi:Calx-beta domain-containing protein [Aquabacter sp. P-9]|uniref:Calx-beta domain-containing protein n=1 Tax=Aquabacter sediminis TaxID=3029197 RepID=UPI00237EBCBF|nr:Calx-beta domain-containing protein [Aquabacter sp. P-9]MDE1569445.1 Calx-beta domain-containing protein [Aquabacter sp. P-9]